MRRLCRDVWRVLLIVTAVLGMAGEAYSQRLLVTTTALSATRESARVYVQSVDMGSGLVPEVEPLPGRVPLSSLLLSPTFPAVAFLSTGNPRADEVRGTVSGWPCISVVNAAPFQRLSHAALVSPWNLSAIGLWPGMTTEEITVVFLGSRRDERGEWQWRIETRTTSADRAFGIPTTAESEWVVPGEPVWAMVIPETKRTAVLCRGIRGESASFCVVDATQAQASPLVQAIPDVGGTFGTNPVGFAIGTGASHLFVFTSGYSLDRPSGDILTWVYALDIATLAECGAPLELPGTLNMTDDPVRCVGPDACWIATRPLGADFAYATLVRAERTGIVQDAQVSVVGASTAIRLAIEPVGTSVAAAFGNRLERWENGRRTAFAQTYDAPIGELEWTPEGLFVGEAGVLHQVDPLTLESIASIQLQSGWINDLAVVPAWLLPAPDADADGLPDPREIATGTSPTTPDTDGDGITDGVDPEPLEPSPRLRLPAAVAFHSRGVGREIKGLMVDSAHARRSSWRLEFADAQVPWLMASPRSGPVPYPVYMGVVPSRYRPDGPAFGTLTFRMAGIAPDTEAAGSPCSIQVYVVPEERTDTRRILWVWSHDSSVRSFRDSSDPMRLRDLAELLAAPPLYFAHREIRRPFDQPLDPYSVVVLTAEAAAQGSIAGAALMDYVLHGGAILLLGDHLSSESASLVAPWLSPAGIRVDASVLVEGSFKTMRERTLCREWEEKPIRQGCGVYVDDAPSILVPGKEPHQAVFAAMTYGHGRIAVLASSSPLESDRPRAPAGRRFATDLFQWLSGATRGAQDQDTDGDELPDETEDRNGNGKTDPGETNYLNPDTDGDGLPDGVEDANLNGRVDEGETSPLNPDSDGDGVMDGADATPLPASDAPHVASVQPSESPAEGGGRVRISGRNFTPECTVWFGDRLAPASRMLRSTDMTAEVPPAEMPHLAPIRVVNPRSGLEGVLPGGFQYQPRSRIGLVLATLDALQAQDGICRGMLSLSVEGPRETHIDLVSVRLVPEPVEGFQWNITTAFGKPASIGQPPRSPWRIKYEKNDLSELLLVVGGEKDDPSIAGTVVVVPFEFTISPERPTTVHVVMKDPRVAARNRQLLDTNVRNLAINLPRTPTDPANNER